MPEEGHPYCPGLPWAVLTQGGSHWLGDTVSFLCTHQSCSQDAPVLTGQLPLDQKISLGNQKQMISLGTQPGFMSKPNVEIANLALVIPECALVFVFLLQEIRVVSTGLICLLGFGCRNNC